MFKKLIGLSLFVFSFTCFSGELVRDAIVEEVMVNGNFNGNNFAVRVAEGSGICSLIFFQKDRAPSVETYNHWFSLASLAMVSGKKVRIHNYVDDSCSAADLIAVSN